VRLTASGGARNPHVLACTLRFLRSGGHPHTPARYVFKAFLNFYCTTVEAAESSLFGGGWDFVDENSAKFTVA
jgi:hypothetical protein